MTDDVFAVELGISNFTPEQLNELQQYLNEEYEITTGTQGAGSRNDSPQSSIEPNIEVQGNGRAIAGQLVNGGGNSRGGEAIDRGSEGGIKKLTTIQMKKNGLDNFGAVGSESQLAVVGEQQAIERVNRALEAYTKDISQEMIIIEFAKSKFVIKKRIN